MAHILVTGGAGFIGSHLVTALVERGHAVRVFDNFSTGKPENLAHLAGRFEMVEGDLRDQAAVRAAMDGIAYVSHQGALGSVPWSIDDPVTANDINVNGTLYVLVAARDAGVQRVVFASSSSIYGDTPAQPKRETMCPAPMSPYALTKLAGETYCRIFTTTYGLETIALRYFNIFGPRQDPNGPYAAVIPKFITALRQGERPSLFGDGTQTRDFTYVANAVQANVLAMLDAPAAACGRTYNIASDVQVSLLELLATVQTLMGSDLAPVFCPTRAGDVQHSSADITAAREALGYAPQVRWDAGLAETIQAFS